jgi:phage N-6-adenine-methyltransferase
MNQLAKLDVEKARDILARCVDLRDCRKIKDQASALTAYARAQKASLSIVNSGTRIKLLAMARLGELTVEMEHAPPGPAPRKDGSRSRTYPKKDALEAAGLSKQEANRCEKVATVQSEIATYVERCTMSGQVATEEGFRREYITKAHSSSEDYGSDEYGTPTDIIEKARRVMGSIDCDPASNDFAQNTVKAAVYYTKEENGLAHEWHGNVWLNPPYSMSLVDQFVMSLLDEHKEGHAKQACLLVNNATDTKWFHAMMLRFPALLFGYRICFLDKNGRPLTSPRVGQALFYIGSNKKRLLREFGDDGIIVERI